MHAHRLMNTHTHKEQQWECLVLGRYHAEHECHQLDLHNMQVHSAFVAFLTTVSMAGDCNGSAFYQHLSALGAEYEQMIQQNVDLRKELGRERNQNGEMGAETLRSSACQEGHVARQGQRWLNLTTFLV